MFLELDLYCTDAAHVTAQHLKTAGYDLDDLDLFFCFFLNPPADG